MSDFLGITEGDIRAAEAETARKRAADREVTVDLGRVSATGGPGP